MPKTHMVKQGEHLSGIAAEYGFRDWHTIWDHPKNVGLKIFRDPHVLFPGDKLFIPDLKEKDVARQAGAAYTFAVNIRKLFLRVQVLDLDNRPVKNADGELRLGSDKGEAVSTDDKGIVIHDLNVKQKKGGIKIDKQTPAAKKTDPPLLQKLNFDLRIGSLNPETKLSGQQARLNNLGYFAGYSLNDLEQLLWAAEEFDCDRIKNSAKAVTKRPAIIGVPLSGQQDGEEKGDPATDTGITDAAIQKKLKEVHGC